MKLIAPNGAETVVTLETLRGLARVNDWTPGKNGRLTPEYAGGTEIYWDDQTTVCRDGSMVVVDEDGADHLLSTCTRI